MKWLRRRREPDPGIKQAQAIRDEARARRQRAEAIAGRADVLLERNHFAEAIERTMRKKFAT